MMRVIQRHGQGVRIDALLFGAYVVVFLFGVGCPTAGLAAEEPMRIDAVVQSPNERATDSKSLEIKVDQKSDQKVDHKSETRREQTLDAKQESRVESRDESVSDAVDFLSRYRVGPGDVISIRLFGEEDLNRERIRLTDTGTIPYPVLGEIRVLGMRPVEIEKFIQDGLRGRYLKNPRVSVTVDEYRPYFVTGQIGRAGSYAYVPGITVLKAITIAGGFKERASRSKIFIAKENNPGERRKVDMATPLEPGDILTVEESFF